MSTSITRLNLTKKLAQWSGKLSPAKVTSTVTPDTAQVADLVEWVSQAWIDIQISQNNRWNWMRKSLDDDSVALTIGTRTLAMATIDATARTVLPFIAHDIVPLRYILLKNPTTESVHRCEFKVYDFFRGYRDRGARPTSKPTRFTILKDGTLEFDPTPDVAYTLNLDWVQVPNELIADATTPDMPAHFHMLIVWYAMIHLMDYDESGGRYKRADRQYKKMLNRMSIEQLPEDVHDDYLSTSEVYSW
jgi:hypothetical protein